MAELPHLCSYIGGVIVPPRRSGIQLGRPQDGKPTGFLCEAGPDGVRDAVANAKATFEEYRTSTLHQRAVWLRAAAAALQGEAEKIASVGAFEAS